MSDAVILAGDHPATAELLAATLATWPEHGKFLRKSFASEHAGLGGVREITARLLLTVVRARGDALSAWVEDYRYMCEQIVMPEEYFFRREDRYRLATFAEADAEVYANPRLMARYMNGLLVSDVLWANHAGALDRFSTIHLAGLPEGGVHLEVGPGHGLLLHLALRSGRFERVEAWDVSETSIAHARGVLALLGEADRVELRLQNLYDAAALIEHQGKYASIVLSEVLEHLEQPGEALALLRGLLAPGGVLWINVPANSPAPDHLFLVRDMDQLEELLASAGLRIVDRAAFPVTGAPLEKALRNQLPVSYVVVAQAADDAG